MGFEGSRLKKLLELCLEGLSLKPMMLRHGPRLTPLAPGGHG